MKSELDRGFIVMNPETNKLERQIWNFETDSLEKIPYKFDPVLDDNNGLTPETSTSDTFVPAKTEPSLVDDIKRVTLSVAESPSRLVRDIGSVFASDQSAYRKKTEKVFTDVRKSLLGVIGDDTPEEVARVLDPKTGAVKDPDTFTGKVLDVATFFVGTKGIYDALGSTGLGKVTKGIIAEQAAEQILADPDFNIANVVKEVYREDTPSVIDYLAADKEDPVLLNRAKMAVTSGILAAGIGAIYKMGFEAIDVATAARKAHNKEVEQLTEDELEDTIGILLKQKRSKKDSKIVKEYSKAREDDAAGVAQIVDQSTDSITGRVKWLKQRWLQSRGFLSEKGFKAKEKSVSKQKQTVSKAVHIARRLQTFIDDAIESGDKKLADDITNALETGDYSKLTENVAIEVADARNLIDRLSATILDENMSSEVLRASIQKNMGQYIRRSYRLYEDTGYVPEASAIEAARETLVQAQIKNLKLRPSSISVKRRKKLEAKADEAIDNILTRGEKETFSDYVSKIRKVNKNFFKGRKDIDPTMRKLMGEIESPTENIILSVQKLSSIVENHKFYDELGELGFSSASKPLLFRQSLQAARNEFKDVDITDLQDGGIKKGTYLQDFDGNIGKVNKVNKNGSYQISFRINDKRTVKTLKDIEDLEVLPADNVLRARAKELYTQSGGKFTKAKYIFEDKQGVFNTKITGTGSYLDNKYTTPEMARAINDLEDTHLFWGLINGGVKNTGVGKYFGAAKGFNQKMKTVYDITTALRNGLGGFQMALSNGMNPVRGGRINFNILSNEITKGGNKVFDRYYEKLQGLGIINTSVKAGEARALMDIAKETNPSKWAAKFSKYADKYEVTKGAKKYLVERPEQIYMATDDYFKMNAFVTELDTLVKAKPNVSREILEDEAAEIVKQTFPNYDRVFKGVKSLRELPVGNFVSFPAEILRTTANIAKQGVTELTSNNKTIQLRGVQRLTGLAATRYGWYVGTGVTLSTLGLTDEQVEALDILHDDFNDSKKFYAKFGDDLLVSDPVSVDIASSITEPVQAALLDYHNGVLDGKNAYDAITDAFIVGAKRLASPFTSEAMFAELTTDIGYALKDPQNATPKGKQLWTDPDDYGDIAYGILAHLATGLAPGTLMDIKNLANAINEVPNPTTGLKENKEARVLELGSGINFRKTDVVDAFERKISKYKRASKYEVRRPKAKFGLKNEELFDSFATFQKRKLKSTKEFYKYVVAMENYGYNSVQISSILRSNGISSRAERQALINGKFYPARLSLKDRKQIYEKMGDFSENQKAIYAITRYTDYLSNLDLHPEDVLGKVITREILRKPTMEDFTRGKFSKGGEVIVPNAPSEPDERIDKNTGLPYNMQAGTAFMDEEDPLRRLGFLGGGIVTSEPDPLKRLGFATGQIVQYKEDSPALNRSFGFLSDKNVEEDEIKNNLHSGALYKAVTSDRDLETEIKDTDKGSFFGGSRAYDMAVEKIKQDKAAGKMTDFEEKLRIFGAGADLVFSPIGDLLSVPLGLAGKGIKAITPDSVEEKVAETAQETVQKVSEWLDENPQFKRHAKNVNALVSIAGFIPATRILKTGFNNVASNTDLILPDFYKEGVKKSEQYGIAGTHYTMAAPKAFVEALLPAGIARRNRTIGIRKREEIEKMSKQSAADMVAGVIQGKNIIEQSPKGKVDDLISDGAINKSYGYEQLSMANKADVKNAMFNKYVDFDIPEHIQDRMMNHMYFGPYKTGKGVVGTNVTGFVGEQLKVPALLKPIDPAKTTIDIKNPKGIQNQAYEAHGGHTRGPAKLNRLFNANGRSKLAVVISKLDKDGNDKFAGKKNSIDNKTNIRREAKNIKDVDNIIANATPEQMKKALATSWGTKEGSDIGIVFKVDEKNPNTIYFQDVYKSGSKESGGVNAMIAVDLDSKKVYNMVTDKHDMLANFKPFGVGSTDRITGTVPTMRSFANIKEKGGHVGRDFQEEARLSLKQLDEYQLDIPESGILSVPTYDAVTGLIPTGRKQRKIVGSKKINRNTLEKIANAKNIEEILDKDGNLAAYKVDGKKMSKAELDSGVNVNASIIQHYAGKATAKDYGDFARRIGQLYLVSGESATVEEARQGRVLNALRKGVQ